MAPWEWERPFLSLVGSFLDKSLASSKCNAFYFESISYIHSCLEEHVHKSESVYHVWFRREILGREEHWPILLSTTCIPAFLQLLILPWFPESPRYLFIDKGDEEGCKKGNLMSYHGANELNLKCSDWVLIMFYVCDGERKTIVVLGGFKHAITLTFFFFFPWCLEGKPDQ